MLSATILVLLPSLAGHTEISTTEYGQLAVLVGSKAMKTSLPLPAISAELGRIRAERLGEVLKGVELLGKRAVRLGLAAPTLEIVERETVPVIASFRNPKTNGLVWARTGELRSFVVVRASVEPVRLNGWSFVATIQHLGEDGNIVRSMPGFTGQLPMGFRTDKATCNHCNLSRRRHDTYVLQHEEGHFARIGSGCLVDYLGDRSAENIVALANFRDAMAGLLADDLGEEYESFGGGERYVDPVDYLAGVALVIATFGWCSRKVAQECNKEATASTAWDLFFPRKRAPGQPPPVITRADITDAHRAEAALAIEWARAIPADTESDFLHNVRVVAGLPYWSDRETGIGAAVLMSFQKEQERLKRMEWERLQPSVALGEVGQRFGAGKGKKAVAPLLARVTGTYKMDGDYGLTTIINMRVTGADGASCSDLVWFASGTVEVVVNQGAIDRAVAAGVASDKAYAALDTVEVGDEAYEAARAALFAARKECEASQLDVRNARREVSTGDLVLVTGTVKKHEASRKTTRMQTHLSRCSLTLAADEAAESK